MLIGKFVLLSFCIAVGCSLMANTTEFQERICGNCGTSSRVPVVISRNFKSVDFDMRPSGTNRNMLKYEIQICSKCNNCSDDITIPINDEKIKALISEKLDKNNLAECFARSSKGYSLGQPSYCNDIYMMLKAAWVADDEENNDAAIEYRKRTLALISSKSPAIREQNDIILLQCDLLRRTRDFSKAEMLVKKLLEKNDLTQVIKTIALAETVLISNKDDKCHSTIEIRFENAEVKK